LNDGLSPYQFST